MGPDATFLLMAGIAAIGVIAAMRLWPANLADDVAHDHSGLPPDHPHLRAHGAKGHHHPLVIDDLHRSWPRPAETP